MTQIIKMQDDNKKGDDEGDGTGLATKVRPKTKKPSLYRVLLLNDDSNYVACSQQWRWRMRRLYIRSS